MSVIGNILWFIFAGLWQGVSWVLVGALWCITIVGIPGGHAVLQDGRPRVLPVRQGGRVRRRSRLRHPQRALVHIRQASSLPSRPCSTGVLLCITVIGIPFGLQCFKQAKLALLPFGAVVRGK